MAAITEKLNALYSDTKACAELVGLQYVVDSSEGIARVKRGNGFAYRKGSRTIVDKRQKARIAELAIPPAWKEVWICPDSTGHILATGIDDRSRKQYIYHPKWRTMRDLIKFYRMIAFAYALPKIRREIERHLTKRKLTFEKVIAIMLWILDNTYIRIGNEAYFTENESVGLTTLTDKNVVIAGPVITLAFKGKSGKDQTITLENAAIASVLKDLCQIKGARLFRYQDMDGKWQPIESDDINHYLQELTGLQISAKDFRTWGGTLMAFMHLVKEQGSSDDKKPEKAVLEAVDQAAAVLGNTRAVARTSYIHPQLLEMYGSKNFASYYAKAGRQRKLRGLGQNESTLLHFLQLLFKDEFELLKH